jgi:hypothetical protein
MNKWPVIIATILAVGIGTQAKANWQAIAAGTEKEGGKVSVAAGLGEGDTKEEAAMDAVNNCAKNTTPVQVLCQFQTAWNTGCGYVITGTGHDKDGIAVGAFGTGKSKALAKQALIDSLAGQGAYPDEGSHIGGKCVTD